MNDYIPESPLEAKIAASFRRVLGIERIDLTKSFSELGGTSLQAARLYVTLKRHATQATFYGALMNAGSVRSMARAMSERLNPVEHGELICLQPAGSEPPLAMCHGAGGTVFFLNALAYLMGVRRPFYALQAAGLSAGSRAARSLAEMAERYTDQLLARVRPPLVLAGYSFGCLVATEMFSAVRRRTGYLPHVILVAPPLPGFFAPYRGRAGDEPAARKAVAMLESFTSREHVTLSDLERRCLLDVYEGNLKAGSEFEPGGLEASATIVIPEGDRGETDRLIGAWRDVYRGGIDIDFASGEHLALVQMPHVITLAERLSARLACLAEPEPIGAGG